MTFIFIHFHYHFNLKNNSGCAPLSSDGSAANVRRLSRDRRLSSETRRKAFWPGSFIHSFIVLLVETSVIFLICFLSRFVNLFCYQLKHQLSFLISFWAGSLIYSALDINCHFQYAFWTDLLINRVFKN